MEKDEKAAIARARALLSKPHEPNAIYSTIMMMRHWDGGVDHQDRAAVLISVALLEQVLENAIWSHCVKDADDIRGKLFRGDMDCAGPLGTFWARTVVARALGVIGPKAADGLEKVRVIRNLFAHTKEHVDFNTQQIADLCHFSTDDSNWWGGLAGEKPETPKDKYFGFMQLVGLYLGVWDDPPKPKLYQNEYLGRAIG